MKGIAHKSKGDYCNWLKTKSFIEERPEFDTNCGNTYKLEVEDRRSRPRIDTCPWCNRGIQVVKR